MREFKIEDSLINSKKKGMDLSMCVAVPGKIIEINGNYAKVNIMNNITSANISLVSAKIGDYVLIHAGCVLEILKKDTAEEILNIFSELAEVEEDDTRTGEE